MNEYLTIEWVTENWSITSRRIQVLCAKGKISGAVKFGRDWDIAKDGRVTTGEYKNLRCRSE